MNIRNNRKTELDNLFGHDRRFFTYAIFIYLAWSVLSAAVSIGFIAALIWVAVLVLRATGVLN